MRAISFLLLASLLGSLGTAGAEDDISSIPDTVCGIGAEIAIIKGKPIIAEVLPKSPAFGAGLQVNDKIVEINGKKVAGLKLDQVIQLIRGLPGTHVIITVLRSGNPAPFTFVIERAAIQLD
ncbi:MAG TPA: PDZ domain-containing protein [Candidatus Methylacidiphilales bacterium]|jgi:carboxyl-terminal processing protease|nr:PDZ domain-containing protein [Candidatus Methylacidiphilales bacterium]